MSKIFEQIILHGQISRSIRDRAIGLVTDQWSESNYVLLFTDITWCGHFASACFDPVEMIVIVGFSLNLCSLGSHHRYEFWYA